MPITQKHVYQLGDFMDKLLDHFGGDHDRELHKTLMTREAFLSYLISHTEKGYGRSQLGVSW